MQVYTALGILLMGVATALQLEVGRKFVALVQARMLQAKGVGAGAGRGGETERSRDCCAVGENPQDDTTEGVHAAADVEARSLLGDA